jgi:putative endonuclease
MCYYVYILHSTDRKRFYIGQTLDVNQRLQEHNSGFYENSYTRGVSDWVLFFSITCHSRKQAVSIEKHLKRMTSRVYLENLVRHPTMVQRLFEKYPD